jgi:hypothetical protein
MLKRHEYVACQARKAGVGFTKQDNCFATVTNPADLARVADTLSAPRTAERLRRLCERWIYGPEGVSRPAGCRTPRPRAAGALLAATDGRRRCCHSRVPVTAGVPSRIGVKALRKAIQALPENVAYARHVVAGGAASCDQESMQRSSFGERNVRANQGIERVRRRPGLGQLGPAP